MGALPQRNHTWTMRRIDGMMDRVRSGRSTRMTRRNPNDGLASEPGYGAPTSAAMMMTKSRMFQPSVKYDPYHEGGPGSTPKAIIFTSISPKKMERKIHSAAVDDTTMLMVGHLQHLLSNLAASTQDSVRQSVVVAFVLLPHGGGMDCIKSQQPSTGCENGSYVVGSTVRKS